MTDSSIKLPIQGGGFVTLYTDESSGVHTIKFSGFATEGTLLAGPGTFVFSGSVAALELNREVVADSGTFTWTGTDASLEHNVELSAEGGTFSWAGTDATLTKGAAPGAYLLSAEGGEFVFTGSTMTPVVDYHLPMDSGAFAFSGAVAGLEFNREIVGGSGTFTWTGSDATLDHEAAASTTTWNPSDKNAGIGLSGSDLIATHSASLGVDDFRGLRAVSGKTSGKYYYEVTMNIGAGVASSVVGVANASHSLSTYIGNGSDSCGLVGTGTILGGGGGSGSSYVATNVVCVAVDLDNNKIWFRVNGGSWHSGDPASNTGGTSISGISGTKYPAASLFSGGDGWTANFGASAYAQTPPSGFGNW